MKQCSLNHFTESLTPWLDNDYLRGVTLSKKGRVTFSFIDGVSDTYEITDCDTSEIVKICRELATKGIPVRGLEEFPAPDPDKI